MTPAEDQAIRANLIAILEWVVTPVCMIASIVQVWLLSRTGAFTRARQFVPAIVVSPMLMIALMFAFAWVLDRLPGGVLRGMYVSLRLLPPEVQFEYAIFAPGIAAAVVAYTIVGKVALMRATRRPIPDH